MSDRPASELSTVSENEAVLHRGAAVHRYDGLRPDRVYEIDGARFRTLPALGERLAVFATVNDVHFGETVCGLIEGSDVGPVFRAEPGDPPYPEIMNEGAVEEISQIEPDVVIAKGDLTSDGALADYERFLELYRGTFGDRLLHVRGNHDAYHAEAFTPPGRLEVALPGVRLAVLDTTWPGHAGGRVSADDLEWLDELAARSDRPVLVFGHHPVSDPHSEGDAREHFGLQPVDSRELFAVAARRQTIRGYFAGHTHRNRVRRFAETGDLPWTEVACVKDYPGTWAEYRVYEGGILQIHRRISTPRALAWSERTRAMFDGSYAGYALGGIAERCFAIP